MAALNKLQLGVWGRASGPVIPADIFIGGVGGFVTNKAILANILGTAEANIKAFNISGSEVQFRLINSIGLKTGAFSNGGGLDDWGGGALLTYIVDYSGKITSHGIRPFVNQTNLKCLIFKGITKAQLLSSLEDINIENIDFESLTTSEGNEQNWVRLTKIDQIRLPLLTNINTYTFNGWHAASLRLPKRIYIPLIANLPNTTNMFSNIPSGVTIYYHPNNDTNNGSGGLNVSLNYAVSRGCTIRAVTDFSLPGDVVDLASGTITSTSVILNFTPPSSVNALDFYQVFIDDGTNNYQRLNFPWKEITASGTTITGLTSGTTYKIKIKACDILWNIGGFSNEITFTTL